MITPKLFNNLLKEEKVDFFVNCQKLLIKYHSDSEFVIRQNNLNEAAETFADQINRYKGHYYNDDNVCLLWNYIYISNPNDPYGELKKNAFTEPNLNYNAWAIDFLVCRKFSDSLEFVKNYNEDKVKYLLLVRHGNPRILDKEELIKNIKSF